GRGPGAEVEALPGPPARTRPPPGGPHHGLRHPHGADESLAGPAVSGTGWEERSLSLLLGRRARPVLGGTGPQPPRTERCETVAKSQPQVQTLGRGRERTWRRGA